MGDASDGRDEVMSGVGLTFYLVLQSEQIDAGCGRGQELSNDEIGCDPSGIRGRKEGREKPLRRGFCPQRNFATRSKYG